MEEQVPAGGAHGPRAGGGRGCINRNLILPKLLLITFYGAMGCLLPFLTLHMKHLGLNHDEITWINSVLPLTSLVGPPIAAYIADRSGRHKTITITSILLSTVFHLMLLFVPSTQRAELTEPPLQFWCDTEGSRMAVVPCSDETLDNPCLQFNGTLQMSSTFRLTNCRYHCQSETPAFLYDNSEDKFIESESRATEGLELPMIEQYSPSLPPHICLVNAANIEKCIYMEKSNSNFTFRRSLKLDTAMLVADEKTQSCQFQQEDLNTDTGYYKNIVCKVKETCKVVCDAQEQSNGTQFLQGDKCESMTGNPNTTLYMYFILRALADMFPAILISLLDAMMLTMVTQYNGDFGRQKMFGLTSVGMTAPLVGWLMDGTEDTYLKYGPVFYVFTAFMIVSAIITMFLPFEMDLRTTSLTKSFRILFKNQELVMLFSIMAVLGSFWSHLETFLYIYLEDLSAPKLLIGLTITIGIVPSVPFLFKSQAIVDYCGHHHVLMVAFVMYSVRFLGYAYMSNPWVVMPLEVLELFTLNMVQVAAATLAFRLAPKSLVATAQALVFIAHFTIGRCVGAFVSGQLIERYGMASVFLQASVLSGALAAIYFTTYYCIRWHSKRQARRQQQDGKAPTSQQIQQNGNGNVANGTYRPIPLDERV